MAFCHCELNKKFSEELAVTFLRYDTDRIEDYSSNNYSIVACVFVEVVTVF
jgi:hypothetical protein